MGLKVIIGDITEAKEELILHQVNCQNIMGAGVAKALYKKFPQIKEKYHNACIINNNLLGKFQIVRINDKQLVINCFTQDTFGSSGKHTKYWAVAKVFRDIANEMPELTKVAIPYGYGCGLGGGDWTVVSALIEEIFGDRAVIYKLGN